MERGSPKMRASVMRAAGTGTRRWCGYDARTTGSTLVLARMLRVLRLGCRGCEAAAEVDRLTVARQRLGADALDVADLVHVLERAMGFAVGHDGLGLADPDAVERGGDGLCIGRVDVDRRGGEGRQRHGEAERECAECLLEHGFLSDDRRGCGVWEQLA